MERDYASAGGIGCLLRLAGYYILIIATILCVSSKKNNKQTVVRDRITTGVEAQLSEKYIVLSCDGTVFAIDYDTYMGFKNSGERGLIYVDTTNNENRQAYALKENIKELGVFATFEDASEYISNLNSQAKSMG